MEEKSCLISQDKAGIRIDLFLKENEPNLSRTLIQDLILREMVSVNGSTIKPHYKLKTGDDVRWQILEPAPTTLKAENIPLDILFEDKDILVLNKPAGLVVHPGAGRETHTLVHALLFHTRELSSLSPERPGIVHRLDKETSGVMVIAKNNFSQMELAKQFKKHTIERRYIALVEGQVSFDEGVVDVPLRRHSIDRKKMAVSFSEEAKSAETFYRVLKRYEELPMVGKEADVRKKTTVASKNPNRGFTALELFPKTGRTHQLRVHLNYLGHPVLGDATYGRKMNFSRLALHAHDLGFAHPNTGVFMKFKAPLPPEMKTAMPGVKV